MSLPADTIAAISTPSGPGAIGILRLSGPEAASIVEKCFQPLGPKGLREHKPRELVYGDLLDSGGQPIDRVLCTYSRGPSSYTGEDTAELQCHGSPMVLALGLEALFAAGARQARAGEFTRRAFLNGRLDLAQAEAVGDLLEAQSREGARHAAGQLAGALSRRIGDIYSALVDVMAHFHAVLDYPDEDIDPFRLEQRLIDTAGLRDTTDPVEKLGVERSRRAMEEAELILVLIDSSRPAEDEDFSLLQEAMALAPTILVWTKGDLPSQPCPMKRYEEIRCPAVTVSARTRYLDELCNEISCAFPQDLWGGYGEILTNARQEEAASRAREAVRRAREALQAGMTPDALLTDVEEALAALGEVTGQSVREDVTDRIFQRFCVGK